MPTERGGGTFLAGWLRIMEVCIRHHGPLLSGILIRQKMETSLEKIRQPA